MSIDIDAFAETLAQELEQYGAETSAATKRAIDKTAARANEVVKEHSTFGGTGEYKRNMVLTVSYESQLEKRITWHVKGTHGKVTSFLERGQETRNGGRTRSFPHITSGDQYVKANLAKNIAEETDNER